MSDPIEVAEHVGLLPKPKIRITYYSTDGTTPDVELPPGCDLEVELIDGTELSSRFFEYQGVKLYDVWSSRHQDMISPSYFAPSHSLEDDNDSVFHEEDLPAIPEEEAAKYEELVPATEENLKGYHDKMVNLDIRQRMAYAIDQNLLSVEDGLDEHALKLYRKKRGWSV